MGFEIPRKEEDRVELPVGDPRALDFATGKIPAQSKLAELEKQDRALDTMDPELIEDAVEGLATRLKENPNDADAQNQVARLKAKLEEIQRGSTH